MKNINIYFIITWLIILLCILYYIIIYDNGLSNKNIKHKIIDRSKYLLDKKPDIINNVKITKVNKF